MEKDTPAGAHFVAIVSAIQKEGDTDAIKVIISDGFYCISARVSNSTDLQTS